MAEKEKEKDVTMMELQITAAKRQKAAAAKAASEKAAKAKQAVEKAKKVAAPTETKEN